MINTVSELELFAKSPAEYYLKCTLKAPHKLPMPSNKEKLSATLHGDIVHKLIEYNARENTKNPSKMLDNIRIEMGISNIAAKEKEEILLQFDSYLRSRYGTLADSKNELPFFMKIGDAYITGKLDMLIEKDNYWEIIDFKTSADKNHEEVARENDLQIKTYALAVAKATNICKGKATFLFLTRDGAEPYMIEITEKTLKETEDKLYDIISKIKETAHLTQRNA